MENNILLRCKSCNSLNRISTEKIKSNPKCGKCKSILEIPSKPVKITVANFQEEVLKSKGLVLLDFWADWCGPCKMLAPILEQLSSEKAGILKVGKINTEEEQELAGYFSISSIPTLMLYQNGRKINQISGALPKHELEKWINSSIN